MTAAKIAQLNEQKIQEILIKIAAILSKISFETSPPEIGMLIYKAIYQTAEKEDPFKVLKDRCTDILLSRYQRYKKQVAESPDPMREALRLAALGNAIDFGANPDFNLEAELSELEKVDFDLCMYDEYIHVFSNAERILYIADNAGETVFDRILIEGFKKPTYYAVRSKPIINDATLDDAHRAGLQSAATIIPSGCDAPGTIVKSCSAEFLKIFDDVDMVISKGQGNYETLSDQDRLIFFLLKVKCPVIARDIGLKQDSIVLFTNKHEK